MLPANNKTIMLQIEIDNGSGFCFGVTTAIKKAEEELANGGTLYCLGDIVHNGMEVERLHANGLVTINHDDMDKLRDVKVLLRAHGERPKHTLWQKETTSTSSMLPVRWCCNCSVGSSDSLMLTPMHRL